MKGDDQEEAVKGKEDGLLFLCMDQTGSWISCSVHSFINAHPVKLTSKTPLITSDHTLIPVLSPLLLSHSKGSHDHKSHRQRLEGDLNQASYLALSKLSPQPPISNILWGDTSLQRASNWFCWLLSAYSKTA